MQLSSFAAILDALPYFHSVAEEVREIVLANLVMIGEIPAPTFGEGARIHFLQERFSEGGLQNCSTDEVGNGLAILPGEEGEQNILVVARADTAFSTKVDHTLSVQPDRIVGPAVGDNSLGLAVLASLPILFERLAIRLRSNLILMGAVHSLGRGDLEGIRFFLENSALPIQAGICVEGVQLGHLSYASSGMLRGEISCTVPEDYDRTWFDTTGALLTINEVMNKITAIPLPKRPRTNIVLGSLEGGNSFDTIATHAVLRFEIRSESADMVDDTHRQIEEIVAEVALQSGAEVSLDILARRKPGGLTFGHPLVQSARRIMLSLNVQPRILPSTAELSAFIDHQIPALTCGITNGEHLGEMNETIKITPICTGLAQLIGILLAIDGGYGYEH
ncbi:MAG: peptidase [Nitrospinota bacterium]|nr:MAG: peptidase [Nitrospinota bacterium]